MNQEKCSKFYLYTKGGKLNIIRNQIVVKRKCLTMVCAVCVRGMDSSQSECGILETMSAVAIEIQV